MLAPATDRAYSALLEDSVTARPARRNARCLHGRIRTQSADQRRGRAGPLGLGLFGCAGRRRCAGGTGADGASDAIGGQPEGRARTAAGPDGDGVSIASVTGRQRLSTTRLAARSPISTGEPIAAIV